MVSFAFRLLQVQKLQTSMVCHSRQQARNRECVLCLNQMLVIGLWQQASFSTKTNWSVNSGFTYRQNAVICDIFFAQRGVWSTTLSNRVRQYITITDTTLRQVFSFPDGIRQPATRSRWQILTCVAAVVGGRERWRFYFYRHRYDTSSRQRHRSRWFLRAWSPVLKLWPAAAGRTQSWISKFESRSNNTCLLEDTEITGERTDRMESGAQHILISTHRTRYSSHTTRRRTDCIESGVQPFLFIRTYSSHIPRRMTWEGEANYLFGLWVMS